MRMKESNWICTTICSRLFAARSWWRWQVPSRDGMTAFLAPLKRRQHMADTRESHARRLNLVVLMTEDD